MNFFFPPETGDRVPVSLLTGFLGSGKTTLLNHLLQQPEMARTAVVINEFGDIGLDQHYVEKSEGEVTVLPNGCLCCEVNEDFKGVMGTLFARRESGEIPTFDRMVIELSGLADPSPVMQMLLNQPMITDNFRLDTVIATVDAIHAARQLEEFPETVNQIAFADQILITKADLVDPSSAEALASTVKALNPSAQILGRLPSSLGGLYTPEMEVQRAGLSVKKHAHAHSHGIACFSMTMDEPVNWRSFSAWLNDLKIRYADQLLRVKGVIYVAGEEMPIAVHGVHHIFHPPQRLARSESGRVGHLVFITKGLSENDVIGTWSN
jgi:G3E family GTPase